VHGVLCATSREGHTPEEYVKQVEQAEAAGTGFNHVYANRTTLDLFWRRQQRVTVDQWGEKTAAAFLGVRLECAQCHKHPFDRWTQVDYRAYANIFSPVSFGTAPESQKTFRTANASRTPRRVGKANIPQTPIREVFLLPGARGGQTLPHPDTNRPLPPKAL